MSGEDAWALVVVPNMESNTLAAELVLRPAETDFEKLERKNKVQDFSSEYRSILTNQQLRKRGPFWTKSNSKPLKTRW